MTEEPENHTLRPLREMRKENQRFHGESRRLYTEALEENLRLYAEAREEYWQLFAEAREENLRLHTETRGQLAFALETVLGLNKTVNKIADAVTDQGSRMETVEGRLDIIDSRPGRIGKATGLVKA